MKSNKIFSSIIILILLIGGLQVINGSNDEITNHKNQYDHPITNQISESQDLLGNFINASLSNYQRNITVLTDSKVVLEDEFTLKILDNQTNINYLNFTVPSSFGDHVHQATFYVQVDNDIGLVDSNNSRNYNVFYGNEVTTYFIDVSNNGESLNDSLSAIYFKCELISINSVEMTGYNSGQRGEFMSPITPMINNLKIEHALIGIGISGLVDEFQPNEISRITNALNNEMPRFTDTRNVISYLNMSRSAFNYADGMNEKDVQKLVFVSQTPFSQDFTTQDLSATVPSAIQNAERNVYFNPWGKVQITETLTIAHLGGERNLTGNIIANVHQVAGYLYTIDSDAIITNVYDEFGSLEQSTRDSETGYPDTTVSGINGKQDLRINFRAPIYGGQTYTFTIQYEFNASEVISRNTEDNVYTLNTTLFSDFNTTVKNMNVEYQFPAGSNIISQTYSANSRFIDYSIYTITKSNVLSAFQNIVLVIDAKNVSYTDNIGFQIKFTYNGVGHFQNFAYFMYAFILLLSIAFGLSNLSFKPSKAVEIEKELIPVDKMDNFFNLFSEKIGAEKRIAELRSRRLKGKLSKKDYDGQVKAVQKRLRDLNPQLEKASGALSNEGGRYDGYVKKVMLASQRQLDIRRNMREAKLSYEKGNIAKNIYTIRIKDFNDQLSKEEQTINKTLTEMIEIIQKYNQ